MLSLLVLWGLSDVIIISKLEMLMTTETAAAWRNESVFNLVVFDQNQQEMWRGPVLNPVWSGSDWTADTPDLFLHVLMDPSEQKQPEAINETEKSDWAFTDLRRFIQRGNLKQPKAAETAETADSSLRCFLCGLNFSRKSVHSTCSTWTVLVCPQTGSRKLLILSIWPPTTS